MIRSYFPLQNMISDLDVCLLSNTSRKCDRIVRVLRTGKKRGGGVIERGTWCKVLLWLYNYMYNRHHIHTFEKRVYCDFKLNKALFDSILWIWALSSRSLFVFFALERLSLAIDTNGERDDTANSYQIWFDLTLNIKDSRK